MDTSAPPAVPPVILRQRLRATAARDSYRTEAVVPLAWSPVTSTRQLHATAERRLRKRTTGQTRQRRQLGRQ